MAFDRRTFLRTAGGMAVLGLVDPLALRGETNGLKTGQSRSGRRVAVFYEEGFPSVDGLVLSREALVSALSGHDAEFMDADRLGARLPGGGYDLLLNPMGSSFPKEAWSAIRKYLAGGGNLLNLGGIPFAIPVRKEGAAWKDEVNQTAYHKLLGITQSFPIPGEEAGSLRDSGLQAVPLSVASGCSASEVYELYYRFTSTRDYPAEDGTSGQRDAEVTPVVGGYSSRGEMLSAPVVVVDRLLGEFAGGRWVLANFRGGLSGESLRDLVTLSLLPRVLFSVQPSFATYLPGETPAIRVRAENIVPRRDVEGECRIELLDGGGALIGDRRLSLRAHRWEEPVRFDAGTVANMGPGFYRVRGEFTPGASFGADGVTVRHETGFWIRDEELLRGVEPLTVGNGYFSRGGKPFPVTGTSYMSSDVHRKFLFEPNPAVWDRDFDEMKKAGINMVRTGIWTGWKNIMLDAGHPDEQSMRALDAFMLTAARHDVPVIFTFFAFLPEAWGGENPYLDPRSLDAQKTFIGAIADRYRGAGGIIWDLINEPSFSSPEHLWYCRPNYDRYERDAWSQWLGERFPGMTDTERNALLREKYRMTADEGTGLPPLEDFEERNIYGTKRPFRAADYRLFSQEMFRRWSGELVEVLKRGRTNPQMVTVGQDEGGTYERPGPHFFADTVDFTCIHNWWYNDDLLWDSIITTVPGKANLVEETGVMFYETADSRAWRSETDVRNLLERKLAISFAAGGAGYINWIWNTNPYMDSENEAAIGLKRADGTHKPEFEVMREYATFFSKFSHFMEGKKDDDVVLVIPHSNLFSTRTYAVEATRHAVRAMEYHCRIGLRAVSEFRISTLGTPPRVLLLPSPLMVDREAWGELMGLVERGSTLVLSGPFEHDRYLIPAGRMNALGLSGTSRAVSAEEHFILEDREYHVGFRGEKIQKISKVVLAGDVPAGPVVLPAGKGEIIYSPIPLELSDSLAATAAFYRYCAVRAGVTSPVSVDTVDASILVRSLVFRDHIMMAFVSEASRPRSIGYTHRTTGLRSTVEVPAQRTIIRFLDRRNGTIVAELNPSGQS